ncbi:MAG: electron transfer flavoprotein subunit alpha/FixB family protein [Proteobacteria bacterium]|nr:electron transfer flavoprotein subunit alpha/FixB family protein [Pseudomonadota bacterium]
MSTLLVLAEHNGTTLAPSFAKLMGAAVALGKATVLVCGKGAKAVADDAATYQGVEKVLYAEHDSFARPTAEALCEMLDAHVGSAQYVLAAGSSYSRGALARFAARKGAVMLSDVLAVDGPTSFTRPMYAGAVNAKVDVPAGLTVLTVRATAFAEGSKGGNAAVEAIAAVPAKVANASVGVELTKSSRPELGSAKVVVSGGRGLGSKENFKIIEDLADALGAAVGASRAAVDAGYVPNDLQVGQTGKVVAPELYVAVGISGAVQHLAGIKGAKTIVAINKDPNAPIFKVADYGLVGDLFEIIPQWSGKAKG